MKYFVVLFSFIVFFGCQPNPKKYTVELVGKNGHDSKVSEITALTDSIAYEKGLISYYGVKTAVKKHSFTDKYGYVRILDEQGTSLDAKLSPETIDAIKVNLSQLEVVKEVQAEDKALPKL